VNLFFLKCKCFCVVLGGNRYIPAGDSGGPSPVNVTDPFTGASRYVPSGGESGVSDSVTSVYLTFSFQKLSLVWSSTVQSSFFYISASFCPV
jgi:hypothetical protein